MKLIADGHLNPPVTFPLESLEGLIYSFIGILFMFFLEFPIKTG